MFNDNRPPQSIFSTTDAGMFKFLPSNECMLRRPRQFGSGTMLFYRTKEVYNNIIHWFVLCALDSNCMSPPKSTGKCNFTNYPDTNRGCHRYDQSAINILLYNYFQFNVEQFITYNKMLLIRRGKRNQYKPRYCK